MGDVTSREGDHVRDISSRLRKWRPWLFAVLVLLVQSAIIVRQSFYILNIEKQDPTTDSPKGIRARRIGGLLVDVQNLTDDPFSPIGPSTQLSGGRDRTGWATAPSTQASAEVHWTQWVKKLTDNPHSSTPSSQTERLHRIREICQNSTDVQIPGKVEKVYVYEKEKIAYCSTHKIASTYWLRVFRWLYNDTKNGHVKSPLNISKFETHLAPFKHLKQRSVVDSAADRSLVGSSYRFLFTREPYARLWSVYIDKFVLPDNYFWSAFAPQITRSVYGPKKEERRNGNQSKEVNVSLAKSEESALPLRPQHPFRPIPPNAHLGGGRDRSRGENTQVSGGLKQVFNLTSPSTKLSGKRGDNSSEPRKAEWTEQKRSPTTRRTPKQKRAPTRARCLQVSFREFLQYIVNVVSEESGQELDDHFRPVHFGCNPCKFLPDFVGKMETMKDDGQYLLRRMRLDDTIIDDLHPTSHVQQEIEMLTDFNFELVVHRHFQRQCVSNKDLEKRLLRAFILNGYLPEGTMDLLSKQLPLKEAEFKRTVLNLYENSKRTSDDIRKQRELMKRKAYSDIPRDLLHSIQKIFRWDFELFGYDPQPADLFS